MKVRLAGFNIDREILNELQRNNPERLDVTPEVISAAYARISRDPRPIEQIRQDARKEVEGARKSNSTIIFKMGHHSVAEHAVFNLDIVGVSRLAMEEVEKFRLCSYTEKSQRYITLEDDFVIPEEIKNSSHKDLFVKTVRRQNEAYGRFFDLLRKQVFRKYSDLAKDPKKHNLLEGWAKEDSRYITSLATSSQVGQTINARVFELLLRRFASSGLSEVRSLGAMLYDEVVKVAPSIVIFHQANDRDCKTYLQLENLSEKLFQDLQSIPNKVNQEVELVEYTRDADNVIAASLLHSSSKLSYQRCFSVVKGLSREEKLNILKTSWQNLQFYDSLLREFEYASLTFNLIVSSACFGQLKRHRMSTITSQKYDINLGVTIPEALKEAGQQDYFMEIIDATNQAYQKIKQDLPEAASYLLTNSHRKRVLMKVNARELYHISRLREDAHAQWDIQNISKSMVAKAKEAMPLTFGLACGKDKYNEVYQSIFGCLPKVAKAVLPGVRKIK
ncbi:MAG: FAD-dependent thymidylate synthase [Candidatus Omnitrophica bacterium]|nr:FAD-dependent thymidylate synthase [Candidatus Omnitrophota bacterium]MDD5429095.1 FAD-dependent thymidylate synthase [Candidatus Omnitrophota bacterium]